MPSTTIATDILQQPRVLHACIKVTISTPRYHSALQARSSSVIAGGPSAEMLDAHCADESPA